MSAVTAKAVSWTELGLVPDTVIRAGIRRLLESKRKEIHSGDAEFAANTMNRFVASQVTILTGVTDIVNTLSGKPLIILRLLRVRNCIF